MSIAGSTLVILVFAAVLEVGGDAAIRHGLVRSAWSMALLGAATLVAFGERLSFGLVVGGALIVVGGLVIQFSPQP